MRFLRLEELEANKLKKILKEMRNIEN